MMIVRLIAMLLVPLCLSGCFLTDVVPQENKTTSGGGGGTEEKPPAVPPVPAPVAAPAHRLARRLSLDLALKLPAPADIAALEADPTAFDELVDSYLQGAAAKRALAGRHVRMWHLAADSLPDLDRYVAEGDTALAAQLTDATRRQLIEMPTLPLRLAFEQGKPFADVFTQGYAIAHEDLLAKLGLTDDGTPWAGEPYRFATYGDGRPAAGPLASPGILAAFGGGRAATPRARTNRILRELTCLKNESKGSHSFNDLTGAELVTDLVTLSRQRASCVGCHTHIEDATKAYEGLGVGSTYTAWSVYDEPAVTAEGSYSGRPYQGLAGLGAAIGSDSRVHRCEIEKLFMDVLQRPLGLYDPVNVSIAVDEFYRNGQQVMAAAKRLFHSKEYAYDTIGEAVIGDYPRNATGVRILGRVQWRGLLDDLVPGNTLVVPDELDPGFDEVATGDARVPTGRYLHAVERLARQTADALVELELAPGTMAQSRRLFNGLADGTSETVKSAVVLAVMRDVWKRLTGETLAENDPRFLDLQTLWSSAKVGAGADEFKRGWRVVLVAMLTHPSFIGY